MFCGAIGKPKQFGLVAAEKDSNAKRIIMLGSESFKGNKTLTIIVLESISFTV